MIDVDVLETPTARSTDPLTSFIAADGITDHAITELQTAILMALSRPMTHDELTLEVRAMGLKRSPQRIRTSCNELVKAKLVRMSDEMGRSINGGRSHKWERANV